MALLLVACGVPFGLAVRRRLSVRLPHLVRAQVLLLGVPIALAGGLLFAPKLDALVAIAALVAAETTGVALGGRVNRAHGGGLVATTASSSNTGIWTLPIAGLAFGPAAATFVAVFEQLAVPRSLLLTSRLRRYAPTPQRARTALVDYAPPLALLTGLALQALLGRPEALGPWLPRVGLASAALNMALIGASMPHTLPRAPHARRALLGAVFRFVPGVLALTALQLAGLHPPAAAWLLAFAPSYFMMTAVARLYGYDTREAVATAVLTTLLAAAALPFVLAALHS